jgi:hypothetical protein
MRVIARREYYHDHDGPGTGTVTPNKKELFLDGIFSRFDVQINDYEKAVKRLSEMIRSFFRGWV